VTGRLLAANKLSGITPTRDSGAVLYLHEG
jgi:hypothetical protein